MNRNKLMREVYLTLAVMVFVLLVLTGSTYAWFTQTAFVNTDVYSASVDGGTPSLLISLYPDRDFDRECELRPDIMPEALYPVSSSDLKTFYAGTAVKENGMTYRYETADIRKHLIMGTVYLKGVNGSSDVYFDDEKFRVAMADGSDAGLRLGLVIGDHNYIFNLDQGNDPGRNTIEAENDSVVYEIDEAGNPVYVEDGSLGVNAYQVAGETAGAQSLLTIGENEVVQVDYYVYLEGCDRNCYNVVQNKDLQVTLGFQGVGTDEQ